MGLQKSQFEEIVTPRDFFLQTVTQCFALPPRKKRKNSRPENGATRLFGSRARNGDAPTKNKLIHGGGGGGA